MPRYLAPLESYGLDDRGAHFFEVRCPLCPWTRRLNEADNLPDEAEDIGFEWAQHERTHPQFLAGPIGSA